MRVINSDEIEGLLAAGSLSAMDILMAYNGLDTCLTFEVADVLRERITPAQQVVYDFERAMQAPAMEMMLRGIDVDQEMRARRIEQLSGKITRLKGVLNELAIEGTGYKELNHNSPDQLKDFFYGHLRLPEVTIRVKGKPHVSTSREALEKLSLYLPALPFVNLILALRDAGKIVSTLRSGIDGDGRLRTSYGVAGTETGRWASRENVFGTGTNLQNWGEETRKIFVARKGWKLGYVDLEQAESRSFGYEAWRRLGLHAYLDACESGDLHTTVAGICYDFIKSRVDAEKSFYRHFTYRDGSKRLGHGTNYMGTPWTMSRNTKIPLNVVEDFRRRYLNRFPEIEGVWDSVIEEVETYHMTTTYMGRERQFFDRASEPETHRKAVAHTCGQSPIGDTLNAAMFRVWKEMPGRVLLLAQIHDAFIFLYREEDEAEILREVLWHIAQQTDLYGRPISHEGRRLLIPSEAKVGWRWCGKDADPDGLVKWKPGFVDERRRQHSFDKSFLNWRLA